MLAAILMLLGGGETPSSVLPLWADLAPGRFHVGYQVKDAISTWYPAADSGERVRFRDYIPVLDEWDQFLHTQNISDETIVSLFDAPMHARHDAPKIEGRFPVVFIAQGNDQSAADQAVLAEFIASHGYVVATIASPRITAEAELAPKAEEVAKGFERVAGLTGPPYAMIAHSFGARAMARYASRHPEVKVLVNLDGPDVALPKTAKVLRLERSADMTHAHFSTWGFAASAFPELHRATKATAKTRVAVTAAARKVLRFLRAGLHSR